MATPPIHQSKLLRGVVTFGPTGTGQLNASGQVRNFACTPTHSYGAQVMVLTGDETYASLTTTWAVTFKIVSDFDLTAGVVRYSITNHDTIQPFSFQPNDSTPPLTITGSCRVVAMEVGGDVNADIEISATWQMSGPPTFTGGSLLDAPGKAKG